MQKNAPDIIYHIATEREFRAQTLADTYTPLRFADDGFIHCTAGRDLLLRVANDYFARMIEPVMVIVIDTATLRAQLRMEPPMPIAGGGNICNRWACLDAQPMPCGRRRLQRARKGPWLPAMPS